MYINIKNKELIDRLGEIQLINIANLKFTQEVLTALQENEIYMSEDIMDDILKEADEKHVSKSVVLEELMFNTFKSRMEGYEKELKEYLHGHVNFIDMDSLKNNPYIKKFRFEKSLSFGNVTLHNEFYKKYEFIVTDTPKIDNSYRLIPRIEVFTERFRFPVLNEKQDTWMSVTPSEINTMKQAVEDVTGRVLVLGCGLGYFPYMASIKDDVSEIVVVEKNPVIADMFAKYILPKFEYKDKVSIVINDMFKYMEKNEFQFDYIFCDTWLSSTDGLEAYCRLKKIEKNNPHAEFSYWLERDIIENARMVVFTNIIHTITKQTLNEDSASDIQNRIYKYLSENEKVKINSISDLETILSDEFIKELMLHV